MFRRLRVGAQRVLLAAFLLSALAHLFGAALFNAFVRPHVLLAGEPERVVVSTATVSIERREPARAQKTAPRKSEEPPPQARPVSAVQPAPSRPKTAPSRRRELAKIVAYAPPAPKEVPRKPADDEAARLAADQAHFARTLARLRTSNDPIASQQLNATGSGNSAKRYGADFSSVPDTVHGGEGYLAPVKTWKDGPYTYYYLRYDVVYPDGSRESGYVPWPVRYLAKDDPFAHNVPPYRMPLPVPMADFVPSSDDDMKPLVAFCYRHRAEVPSCPIMHD